VRRLASGRNRSSRASATALPGLGVRGCGGSTTVDPSELRYVQLRRLGTPARTWGGYSQDFDAATHVFTREHVETHPAESWGIVNVENPPHSSSALLAFDFDSTKRPTISIPTGTGSPVTLSSLGVIRAYVTTYR